MKNNLFQLIDICKFTVAMSLITSNSKGKDEYLNDKDGVIPLTLWNDCIKLVLESGSFTLSNVSVKQPSEAKPGDKQFYIDNQNKKIEPNVLIMVTSQLNQYANYNEIDMGE